MVTLSTANKTNAELAAERGRQLDECERTRAALQAAG